MKITATYKTSIKISPESFEVYTEVIHLKPSQTLNEAYAILVDKMVDLEDEEFDIHVELHFNSEELDFSEGDLN